MRELIRRLFRFQPDLVVGVVTLRRTVMHRPKGWDAYWSYEVTDEPFPGSVPVLMIELPEEAAAKRGATTANTEEGK